MADARSPERVANARYALGTARADADDEARPEGAEPGADRVFTALAHPSRRRILQMLQKRGVMSAGRIAAEFSCTWPTTTRHLRTLEKAQLVSVRRSGRERHYRLNPEEVRMAWAWIGRCVGEAPAPRAVQAPAAPRKVEA